MASSFVHIYVKKDSKKLGRIKHVPKNLGFFFKQTIFYFLFLVGKEHRRDGLRT